MATFDQRGQEVQYQYNAETINFGSAQNTQDVVEQLKGLQQELARAIEQKALVGDAALDAEYEMKKALSQAEKPAPDKTSLLAHLNQASGLVAGISGLAEAFSKAVTVVGQFF